MTLKLEDILNVLRSYEYDQECIMDACDELNSAYDRANIRWHAANEIYCRIFNELVKEGKFES